MKTRSGFILYLVLILLAGGAIALPSISNPDPASDPTSIVGEEQAFRITVNETSNITWYLNDAPVHEDTSVLASEYLNNSAPAGKYNVTAIATNVNGSDQQTWNWTVSNATLAITDFKPISITPGSTTGVAQEFNITLNQEATIRWLIDGKEIRTSTASSDSYSNNTAPAGTYNVTAIAENVNASVQQTWEWTVSDAQNMSLEITEFTPADNPSSVLGAYQNFTVRTNQNAKIEWYIDGDLEKTYEDVSFTAFNVSDRGIGSYNVTAIASNVNGTDQQKWTWKVASKTYLSGDRIWDANADQSLDYTWTALSYSGFYYDLNTGEGSETMTVHLDSRSDRSINEGDLQYETTPITTEFKYSNWGDYQIIGFMAEKYFAGYLDTTKFTKENSVISDGILSKILVDDDNKKSLYAGSSLILEEGYALNIVEVDVNGNNVYVTLTKDGSHVDETIVKNDGTYVYETELGNSDKIPIIAVHFGNIFQGTEASAIFINAIFQISDEYITIESGDTYGVMKLKTVSDERITMENDRSISLTKGKVTTIMGKLKFIIADSSTLRFAPFVDMSEVGTYELRGTVAEGETFEWTPLNFEGFYYNIDEGIGTEKLRITGLSGRTIDSGNLVYTSTPENVSFQYDDWGSFNVIGFMADKYFAGYHKNEFTTDVSIVSQGQLSKVLLDEKDKKSLVSGSALILEEGYALNIKEVDINGKRVRVSLTKDGTEVDDGIVASGETYAYKTDLGDVDDVPVVVVHFKEVFQGAESSAVFVDGIFQISDDYVSIESDDSFGKMKVTGIDESGITMKNKDAISLTKGKDISIMGDINFKVADKSNTVRFYPFIEVRTSSSNSLNIEHSELVAQGTALKIAVTSRGMAVSNATLKMDSMVIGSTSAEGTLQYTPDKIGNFTIRAEKEGYVSASSNLEVISPQDESRKMSIDIVPEEVYEGTTVQFLVLKTMGREAIEGAEVALDGKVIGNTSKDGNITHTMTEVGMHKLIVSKPGLLDTELNFEVKELAAKFTFTNLQISPLEIRAGDKATISVDVANTGTAPGNYTAELKINGTVVDSQEVALNNGNSTTLKFVHVEKEPGTYVVSVQQLSVTYEVLEKSGTIWYILGGIILLAAAGVGYLFTAGGWTVEMAKEKINEFIGSIR